MKIPLVLLLIAFLGGCATRQEAPAHPTRQPVSAALQAPPAATAPQQEVEVDSSPAGAAISVNGNFVCTTPGKFSVTRNPNRYGFLPRMTVIAQPPQGAQGLSAQTRVFDGYTETPPKIEFNMAN